MKMINQIRDRLEKKGFDCMEIDKSVIAEELRIRNLEIWSNKYRVIIIKSYTSYNHLLDWKEDQIAISLLYNEISSQLKNNIYFLLVLEWIGIRTDDMLWKITEIEKNHRVCRKYIIDTESDLKRIPHLSGEMKPAGALFNFDKEFKGMLLIPKENQEIPVHLKKMVDLYFEYYDHYDEQKQEKQLDILRVILRGETHNED